MATAESTAPPEATRELSRLVRHIVTPEYPPELGGVSGYVAELAQALAKEGEEVHVWCPALAKDSGSAPETAGPRVHRGLGAITPGDLKAAGERLDRFPVPRNILVQWVPHGFRYRSMNLGFCLWVWKRARQGDQVEIMVHEPFLLFEGGWRQYGAALVHRLMTIILLRAAKRVWVSIPRYERMWRPYTLGRSIPFGWLPPTSNVAVIRDARLIQELRSKYAPTGGLLIGHFGTFGKLLSAQLEQILPPVLMNNDRASLVLIGFGGDAFQQSLAAKYPGLAARIHYTGSLPAGDPALSCILSACDLMIQPYPDGASARRTSLLAPLEHGKAVVTTSGPATEEVWFESGAVAIAPAGDPKAYIELVNELCADLVKRTALARAARKLFDERFDIRHALAALREASSPGVPCAS